MYISLSSYQIVEFIAPVENVSLGKCAKSSGDSSRGVHWSRYLLISESSEGNTRLQLMDDEYCGATRSEMGFQLGSVSCHIHISFRTKENKEKNASKYSLSSPELKHFVSDVRYFDLSLFTTIIFIKKPLLFPPPAVSQPAW